MGRTERIDAGPPVPTDDLVDEVRAEARRNQILWHMPTTFIASQEAQSTFWDNMANPFLGWPGHARYYELLLMAARIHAAKNQDYADDVSDPLANFRECENFGVGAADGCMTRLSDKVKRLYNLVRKEKQGRAAAVTDEGVNDTLIDLMNYAAILRILREEASGS